MTNDSNADDRKSRWAAAGSQYGLRIRLFDAKDIKGLAAIARKPIAPGTELAEIARKLDLAFYGAYIGAEQARIELVPAELQKKCETRRIQGIGVVGGSRATSRSTVVHARR